MEEKNKVRLEGKMRYQRRISNDEVGKLIYANHCLSRKAIQQILATDSQSLFRKIEEDEEFYCRKISTLTNRKRKIYSIKKQVDYKNLYEAELKSMGLLALRRVGLLTGNVSIDEQSKNFLTKILVSKTDSIIGDIELIGITPNNLSKLNQSSFIANGLKVIVIENVDILNQTVNKISFLEEYLLIVIEDNRAYIYVKQENKVFKLEDKQVIQQFKSGLIENKRLSQQIIRPYQIFEEERGRIKENFKGGRENDK